MRQHTTPTPPNQLIWLPTGGHIGDAIMIVALFSEMLERNPELTITYLVRRNADRIAEIASPYSRITVRALPQSIFGALRAIMPILLQRAAVVAPPPRNTHPLVIKLISLVALLRRDDVVGFTDGRGLQPFSLSLVYDKQTRYIDNLRNAMKKVGYDTRPIGASPHLVVAPSETPDFPFKHKQYIVVHPFPHMAKFKTLPLKRWKTLLNKIQNLYPEYGIVITGADVDESEAKDIRSDLGNNIYLGINFTLPQVANILQKASLYIGVDTGPSHLAGVLHVPSVIIAQQNEPVWLPDYNPNAILVWNKEHCVCSTPGEKCIVEEDSVLYRRCVYYTSDESILAAAAHIIPPTSAQIEA